MLIKSRLQYKYGLFPAWMQRSRGQRRTCRQCRRRPPGYGSKIKIFILISILNCSATFPYPTRTPIKRKGLDPDPSLCLKELMRAVINITYTLN